MKQQSWNKVQRWFAWLGGGVIVLCLTACGFWYWINISPQIKISTPVMPNPNGYDYFNRAAAAYVEDSKGVDEINDPHFVPGKHYSIVAKEAWLKKNAKAFYLLREGLKYPALHPPIRSASDTSYLKYTRYRALARALAVESHARGERGNWNSAVQSALDDYHFGNQIARGGTVITGMVSGAIQGISLVQLNDLVSHTNATTAKIAASGMEKIYDQRYPLYKNLQGDKWLNISDALQIMNGPPWRIGAIHTFDIPIFDYPKIFTISKRKFLSDLTQSMNELIKNAHRPYVKQWPTPDSGDPLVEAVLPDYKTTRWIWARSDAYSVEIMTMYALHAYKIDNGHYPKSLKALVPTYLHEIPIDPFDGIASIQYKLQGNKYLLWSIGPDGVDNHGTPIINQNKPETARYRFLDPDSKGDVVAGINTP